MPRIGATLGVLATIAFCIGFNISRYPRVWDVIADTPGQRGSELTPRNSVPIAPTRNPAAPKTAPNVPAAAHIAAPRPSAKSAAAEKPPLKIAKIAEKYALNAGPAEKKAKAKAKADSRWRGDKPKKEATAPKTAAAPHAAPGDAKPSKNTTPAAGQPELTAGKPGGPAAPDDAPPPLVPVVPVLPDSGGRDLAALAQRNEALSPWGGPSGAGGVYMIRRLPPIDRTEPRKPLPPLSALGPIPFYPTTGVN